MNIMVGLLKLYFSGPAYTSMHDFNVLALLGLHDLNDIIVERRLVTTTVAFLFMSPFLEAGAYLS